VETFPRSDDTDASAPFFQEFAKNRAVIEQAKGMLMLLYGVDDQSAFEWLRRQSQNTNVKVRELAAQLVSDGRERGVEATFPSRCIGDKALVAARKRPSQVSERPCRTAASNAGAAARLVRV
jgi:hypothetical protein